MKKAFPIAALARVARVEHAQVTSARPAAGDASGIAHERTTSSAEPASGVTSGGA